MLHERALSSIGPEDIAALVTKRTREGKHLEYKSQLPDGKDRPTKELLADISSFANAGGGVIIFGVNETQGEPTEICGVSSKNVDAEILRIDNLARSSIEPRLPDFQIRPVEASGKVVLIARIGRSWLAPHVVDHQKHWRFYSRNSAGKYPLDVAEVRNAFALSADSRDQISRFRSSRLSSIIANEVPVPLQGNRVVVAHLFPLASLDPGFLLSPAQLEETELTLLSPYRGLSRFCLDGLVSYRSMLRDDSGTSNYTLSFRSGRFESVSSDLTNVDPEGDGIIAADTVEMLLVRDGARWPEVFSSLGISPPLVFSLSVLNVRGFTIRKRSSFMLADSNQRINEHNLILPEIVIENFAQPIGTTLRPAFDALWNAAGYRGSLNYDADGQWVSPR